MTTSEAESHEKFAQYVCVLNGVMYRMNADMSTSGTGFRLVPEDVMPAATRARALPVIDARSLAADPKPVPPAAASPRTADAKRSRDIGPSFGSQETASKPFNRDGAEPLRAGHPDLWNLLVAGTCLEGTSYQPGW